MTAWDEMSRVEFDPAGLTKKQRDVVATAPGTLFPRLLPDPAPKPAKPAPPQLDGQADLFGEEA